MTIYETRTHESAIPTPESAWSGVLNNNAEMLGQNLIATAGHDEELKEKDPLLKNFSIADCPSFC